MKIEIIKSASGKFCCHNSCKKEPRYITPKGRIKKGNTAAKITHKVRVGRSRIREHSFYYCRTCIDQLLLECRANLDSKLWIFQ